MSPELQPMAMQYYCHVSLSVSRDRLNCHLRGFWSRDNEVFFTYTLYMFLYDFNTVVCQFLVTWTSIGCLIVQLLRFSGFSLINPISFFLYSPFKSIKTTISYTLFYHIKSQWYRSESEILIFAWRVTWKYVYSPFKACFVFRYPECVEWDKWGNFKKKQGSKELD